MRAFGLEVRFAIIPEKEVGVQTKEYRKQYYIKNKKRIAKYRKTKWFKLNLSRWKKKHFKTEKGEVERLRGSLTRAKVDLTNVDLFDLNKRRKVENCKICGNKETVIDKRINRPRFLSIDHNHITGKIRGLICQRCNSVLGYAGDKKYILINAVKYLGKRK